MRLTTVRTSTGDRAGRIEDDRIVLLPWNDLSHLLSQPGWQNLAGAHGETVPLADADLATLLPDPDKIICVGLNYVSHIEEMGRQRPDHPTLFAKYRGALIGPTDAVQLPAVSEAMDWEVELGVVIGRAGRYVAEADALDHVVGYCVVNDATARDWQHRTTQFLAGKTFESTTPVGPVLVTPDELFRPDGLGLRVQCEVDGELMQDGQHLRLVLHAGSDRRLREPDHHPPARRPDRHGHARRRGRRSRPEDVSPTRIDHAHHGGGDRRTRQPVRAVDCGTPDAIA